MKQFWLQFTVLALVSLAGTWVTFHPETLSSLISSPGFSGGGTRHIMVLSPSDAQKGVLTVEVAATEQERAKGLGGRDSLDPNSGMLFVFDKPGRPQFWMKGMRFPLDFIWIDGRRVVGIIENVPAPQKDPDGVLPLYSSTVDVDKVLEVNAGYVKSHGIAVGDSLREAS